MPRLLARTIILAGRTVVRQPQIRALFPGMAGASGADFDVAAFDGNSTQNVTAADIGNALSFNNFLGSRIYSFDAKTTAVATPAPGMGMLTGLAGLFIAVRRKRAS